MGNFDRSDVVEITVQDRLPLLSQRGRAEAHFLPDRVPSRFHPSPAQGPCHFFAKWLHRVYEIPVEHLGEFVQSGGDGRRGYEIGRHGYPSTEIAGVTA